MAKTVNASPSTSLSQSFQLHSRFVSTCESEMLEMRSLVI